jgi:hypothetical protein
VSVRDEAALGLDPPGSGFDTNVMKAEPMSLRVSDLARTVSPGAIAGTWLVGERGGLEIAALCLFSSTMILSSLIASSTVSFFERRRLPFDGRLPFSARLFDLTRVTV